MNETKHFLLAVETSKVEEHEEYAKDNESPTHFLISITESQAMAYLELRDSLLAIKCRLRSLQTKLSTKSLTIWDFQPNFFRPTGRKSRKKLDILLSSSREELTADEAAYIDSMVKGNKGKQGSEGYHFMSSVYAEIDEDGIHWHGWPKWADYEVSTDTISWEELKDEQPSVDLRKPQTLQEVGDYPDPPEDRYDMEEP